MSQNNTKKIAVVAANGRVGSLVVAEAVRRGFDVTAIARSDNRTQAQHFLQGDVLTLTREQLEGFDAVVDAVGGWSEDTLHLIPDAAKHLAKVLAGTNVRLVVVGGAGSLFMNPEHTMTLAQTPEFPEAFKGVANAHQQALDTLRGRDDVHWTYVSPAADFQAEERPVQAPWLARSLRPTRRASLLSPTPITPLRWWTRLSPESTSASASRL